MTKPLAVALVTEDPVLDLAVRAMVAADPALDLRDTLPPAAAAAAARARGLAADVLLVDADARDAPELLMALSLLVRTPIVALHSRAWPGTEGCAALRRAGAAHVVVKPGGPSAMRLAGPAGHELLHALHAAAGAGP